MAKLKELVGSVLDVLPVVAFFVVMMGLLLLPFIPAECEIRRLKAELEARDRQIQELKGRLAPPAAPQAP
jgi:hypothetical protein